MVRYKTHNEVTRPQEESLVIRSAGSFSDQGESMKVLCSSRSFWERERIDFVMGIDVV